VARNRKRAKERRARRPQPVATTRAERAERDDTPGPIAHAAPDVELAEAQLAIGRPDAAARPEAAADAEEEYEASEFDAEVVESADGRGRYGGDYEGPPSRGGANLVAAGGGEPGGGGAALAQRRVGLGGRLVGFLQGSWRELQRVQWPDRRQVAQATGVVVGFVIVAAVFLGVSDLVAQKLVNFILK
jgi:preprotein translocase subunit SecE